MATNGWFQLAMMEIAGHIAKKNRIAGFSIAKKI
jgi:hypothetical protein